ncbi:hypothetical protein ACSV4D_09400 [Flavobacterium sp. ARAG 55.4]|uniref:hypothetical protein n=1 Tax=Flavobacterium sp. ARAG 55.4 TaxID=3451357 RepID=UPI003F479BBB
MSNQHENKWRGVKVFIGGREMKGIVSIDYNEPVNLAKLESDLLIAEQNEEYELCAEIKKQIDQLKSKP